MSVTIQNLTDQRIFLRFNSGQTCHLGPQQALSDVMPVEVKGNAKIAKLEAQQVITVKRPAPPRKQSKPAGQSNRRKK